MGEIQLSTKEQKIILDAIRQDDFLCSHFYFTGGTALCSVYLQHRESDDLDFFSKEKFDTQIIFGIIDEFAKKYSFTFTSRFVEVVYIFNLHFADNANLKVDFAYYPHRKIEKETMLGNLRVDSLADIAVNKLLTISQRTEVKDFVDLYFLLQKFPLWDLISGLRVKFGIDIDQLLLSSDFLKVSDFTTLPKMLVPLTLTQLQDYFIAKAKEIALTAVE